MLRIAMYTTIKTLYEKGYNKSEIAKMTKHDWKTISKVIKALNAGKEVPDKKPHPLMHYLGARIIMKALFGKIRC